MTATRLAHLYTAMPPRRGNITSTLLHCSALHCSFPTSTVHAAQHPYRHNINQGEHVLPEVEVAEKAVWEQSLLVSELVGGEWQGVSGPQEEPLVGACGLALHKDLAALPRSQQDAANDAGDLHGWFECCSLEATVLQSDMAAWRRCCPCLLIVGRLLEMSNPARGFAPHELPTCWPHVAAKLTSALIESVNEIVSDPHNSFAALLFIETACKSASSGGTDTHNRYSQ